MRPAQTPSAETIKGNDLHSSDASASMVFARAVGWRNTTSETTHYRGAFISENIAPSIVVGFSLEDLLVIRTPTSM